MAHTPTTTPEHPGAYVQREVLPEGMTVTEAAQRLGIGRPALSRFLNGRSSVSLKMAQRLEREFGVDAALLHQMQARYDEYHTPPQQAAVTKRSPLPVVTTIEADEIDRWARGHQARRELAVLLRRLVHSTTDGVEGADFPGFGQAEREGWDGRIEKAASNPWVPEGASRWEFTCNRAPKNRADHYFDDRQKAATLENRRKQAFVFVTPRNWPGKTKWARGKRRLNEWREVRAYDATNLEQWLEASPATQVWFAERLGRPVEGFQSLERFWDEWSVAADPPLSPALFAEPVEKHSRVFFTWLESNPTRPFTVSADSRDEAIAFMACLLKVESPSTRRQLDQAVVFHCTDAVQRLTSFMDEVASESKDDDPPNRLLAVAGKAEVEHSLAAWRRTWRCVAIEHSNAVGLIDQRRDVELGLATPAEFGKALAAMNISGARVDQLDLDTARSPTILRRRLSTTPEVQRPNWTRSSENLDAAVVPALVGAWNAGLEADRGALACVAGNEYEQVEASIVRLHNLDEAPVWSIGQYRGVCSRIDALFSVAPAVTRKNLDDFFVVAESVLSERDPALDLPPKDRWMAAVHHKVRRHSGALRNGIRDTLILLAEYGERLFDHRLGSDNEHRVATLVQRLLAPLTLETLLSHKTDLRGYAEAAPATFLDLLEEDLATGDPAVFEFLKPLGSGEIRQDCPRTDLLWALECLAWFPGLLPRVASVLAQLSEQKISDRNMNTPIASLFSLFRSWMPQTVAPLDERLGAIKQIARLRPRVGWHLCVGLLPRRHDWLVPNPVPKWRGDKSSAGEGALRRDAFRAVEAAREVLLNWTPQDERTLADLVDHLESFSESAQTRIWDLIDEWTVSASDDAKTVLQDRIRKHYPALDDERASGTLRRLTPTDSVPRNLWLFASKDPEIGQRTGGFDYSQLDSRIRSLRIAGLREILDDQGSTGLLRLVATCEAPRLVGYLLGSILDVTEVKDLSDHLLAHKGTTGDPCLECLTGLLSTADPGTCKELVQGQRDVGDDSTRLELLLAMPFRGETWRLLDEEDEQFRKSYWQQVEPSRHAESPDELRELVDRLIEAERPSVAFGAVNRRVPDIGTQRLLRLLRAIVRHEGEPLPNNYSLSQTLQHLERRADVKVSELAEIEFAFFPLLRYSEYGCPNLQRRLLEAPSLFTQLVALAFGPKNDKEDRSPWRVDDPEQRGAVGTGAYQVLTEVQVLPGSRDGKVDLEELKAWLTDARSQCADLDRGAIADGMIGQWLARASAKDGVARPRSEVAGAIEWMASDDVDTGFGTGAYNARGVVTSFGIDGDQDRALAKTYRKLAIDMVEYPRMRRILEGIARTYADQAKRMDRSGEIANRLPSIGPVFPG